MRKNYILAVKSKLECKTLAVIDRFKFRNSLNWTQHIKGSQLSSITQLSNHAVLLNVKKTNNKYECYLTSVTSKSKSVALINGINADLMEFKLPNGESRYIPKVIYKYTFTKDQFLDLFDLEHQNSINLDNKIRLWDSKTILDDWPNMIQFNECHYIDLDAIKITGKLDVSIFKDQLSDTVLDIDVMKNLIKNEDL